MIWHNWSLRRKLNETRKQIPYLLVNWNGVVFCHSLEEPLALQFPQDTKSRGLISGESLPCSWHHDMTTETITWMFKTQSTPIPHTAPQVVSLMSRYICCHVIRFMSGYLSILSSYLLSYPVICFMSKYLSSPLILVPSCQVFFFLFINFFTVM